MDVLRGLAALTVVFYHLHAAYGPYRPRQLFLRPIFAGHEAVILFFVLSGYVLSLPVWQGRQVAYPRYLVRRITRIYLPFAGALLIAALVGRHFLYSRLPLTDWFRFTWQEPIDRHQVLHGLMMSRSPAINTAFWSLRYEMQMSLIFPAVCLALGRMKAITTVAGIALTYGSGIYLLRHTGDPSGIAETLRYAACFVSGALLAQHQAYLRSWWLRSPGLLRATFLAASLFLYYRCFSLIHGTAAMRVGLADRSPEYRGDAVILLGTLGIILAAASSPFLQGALQRQPLVYLGHVSYSLYLIHGTVLFALLNLLYGHASKPLIGVLYLVLTFAVSHCFYELVEKPSHRFGRRLTCQRTAPPGKQNVII